MNETTDKLAEELYAAYVVGVAGNNSADHRREPLPKWKDLGAAERDGWLNAASRALRTDGPNRT